MITFILIHGTVLIPWAPNATWTTEDSLLRYRLREKFGSTREFGPIFFEAPVWSGKNRVLDRQQAALKIQDTILKTLRNRPQEKIFLISHSHGGSAVSYFLRENPELSRKISGYIFLATPFIFMRPIIYIKELLLSSLSMLGITVAVIAVLLMARIGLSLRMLDDPLVIPVFLTATTLLFASAMYLIWKIPVERLACQLKLLVEKQLRPQETAVFPKGLDCIFLRAVGDEAASALSFGQFVSMISSYLSRIIGLFAIYVRQYFIWSAKKLIRLVSISTFLAIICVWLLGYFQYLMGDEIVRPECSTPWSYIFCAKIETRVEVIDSHSLFPVFLVFARILGLVGTIILSVLLFGFYFAVLVRLCLSFLIGLAFGVKSGPTGLLVDFAVEPLPLGVWKFSNVSWETSGPSTLIHSQPYSDPGSLNFLCEWIAFRLEKSPTSH